MADKYFSGYQNLSGIDLGNLVFGKSDPDTPTNYLGSGAFGDVYFLRDKSGNENKEYVVKVLRKKFLDHVRSFLGLPKKKISQDDLNNAFVNEVKALEELKGQGIGPEIVYANFENQYYIIERMDITLMDLLRKDAITPSQILQLLALTDRYLISNFFHDDMHENNIMWSNKLNDFRIIDWGISLIIDLVKNKSGKIIERNIQRRKDQVFGDEIMWYAMLYTYYKIDNPKTPNKEQWIAVKDKIRDYIKNKFPDKVDEYDIFSPGYKHKTSRYAGLRSLFSLINPPPGLRLGFKEKVKREMEAMGFKGGVKKTRCRRKTKRRKTKRRRKTRRRR